MTRYECYLKSGSAEPYTVWLSQMIETWIDEQGIQRPKGERIKGAKHIVGVTYGEWRSDLLGWGKDRFNDWLNKKVCATQDG